MDKKTPKKKEPFTPPKPKDHRSPAKVLDFNGGADEPTREEREKSDRDYPRDRDTRT